MTKAGTTHSRISSALGLQCRIRTWILIDDCFFEVAIAGSPEGTFDVDYDVYDNPLIGRYASAEMSQLWSPQTKHSTWRQLWIALAEVERELGLDISQTQIDEMKLHVDSIDFERAAK